MRFYGLSYKETLALPIRAFWFLSGQIDRLRAEEVLAWIPAHSTAMGGKHVKEVIETLHRVVGQPIVTDTKVMSDEAKRKLRARFGRK